MTVMTLYWMGQSVTVVVFVSYIAGEHNLLVLFDQHAAHERVRLEALQAGILTLFDFP